MSIGGLLPSVIYRMAEKDSANSEKTRSSAAVRRAVEDFQTRVARVQTVDDVFKDRKLLQFLMEATGNPREMEQPAILRKALTDKLDDNNLARKLNKGQLYGAAAFFEFAAKGVSKLKSPAIVKEIIESYVAATHEKNITQNRSDVSRARYFEKNVAEAADDVFKLLGDPLLRRVLTTTLGLPDQIAVQSVEAQARAVTSRVDISKFKDPGFTKQFLKRYFTIADQEAMAATQMSSPILALFNNEPTGTADLLQNINSLRSNRVNIVV